MFDKLRNALGFNGDEDEEYINDDLELGAQEEEADSTAPLTFGSKQHSNKVVNINTTAQLQVVLVKPERLEDCRAVADHLNAKRTVVLNLETPNRELSRRMVDFLSGVAYANRGDIQPVANSTFIITPYNVDIMGDLLDELESNGVFF